MELSSNSFNSFREFAEFRLDVRNRILWRGNDIVDLPPRAIDVLCVLTEHPGEVVTKQFLIETIWQDSFVEDSNLTHQIYGLRKAFKENGCEDELIQTIPRRGYRFTGTVSDSFDGGNELIIERKKVTRAVIAEVNESEASPVPLLPPARSFNKKHWSGIIVVVTIISVTVAVLAWRSQVTGEKKTLGQIRSLAVLPIRTIEGTGDEQLETRLTDSLITKIATLNSITVRPTGSVMRFRGSDTDPLEIGKLLEVDAVLIGRTQSEGGRIRLNLQMIAISDGEQLWAAQIDGDAGRLLAFQDAVTARLIDSLELSPEQMSALEDQPTTSAEAFEEYTRGRYFWNKRTISGLNSAIDAFGSAIRLDPQFAEAYIGLADSYFLLFDYSYDRSEANVRLANQNLDKAIALDPRLPDAYVTRGHIRTTYEWNWAAGEASLQKAIELAPRSPNAHHRYAMLLVKLGKLEQAEHHIREARRLDPTSSGINMNLGAILMFGKRYDEAEAQIRKTIELDGTFAPPRWYLARCLWLRGNRDQSISAYQEVAQLTGFTAMAELLAADKGSDPVKLMERLIKLWKNSLGPQSIGPYDIAKLYASIGDRSSALDWLEMAYEQKHPWLSFLAVEPEFEILKAEPRYVALLKNLNFPTDP